MACGFAQFVRGNARAHGRAWGGTRFARLQRSQTLESPMAQSSILGADRAPKQAPGRDSGVLGPSDSSDSGSDIQGEVEPVIDEFGNTRPAPESDSDAEGTGERASAAPLEHVREGGDIAPDRV